VIQRKLPGLAACILLLSFAMPCFAGKYNKVLSIADEAPEWSELPATDGSKYGPEFFKDRKVLVIVFTCNSCPYSVDYEDRLVEFSKKYCGPKGKVSLLAINVNKIPEDNLTAMKERAKRKGFNFPYLFDESQKIARDFGAIRTPQCFVLDEERRVVYMGTMDDSANSSRVKVKYVEDVVDAVLSGNDVKITETPPIGCLIRFERKRRK
jgi:peroxiredoxin